MKLPLFIAFRYFVSKKKHNIINVISGISIGGITFGTMALIIVLSVFNGFEALIISVFNSINPDLHISAKTGKSFELDSITISQIKNTKGIIYFTEVVEENVLLKHKDKQHIAVIKGVSTDFFKMSKICNYIFNGECYLEKDNRNYTLMGNGVAYVLEAKPNDVFSEPIAVYTPRKDKSKLTIKNRYIYPGGIFETEYEYDSKYIITSLEFAKELLSFKNEITAIEIGIDTTYNVEKIKKEVKNILGDNFEVKNRFEQQELLYKVMKSEKWAIYLILTFILIIAVFNVIGTLTMLVLEKKNDASILWTLGATNKLLKKIFFFEGLLISFTGAFSGLILGSIICWAQQTFGIIPLETTQSFIIEAYPVKMHLQDFLLVFATVVFIGIMAAYIPIRNLKIEKIEKGK